MKNKPSFFSNLMRGVSKRANKAFNNPYSKVNVNWVTLKYLKHLPPNKIHSHDLMKHKTFYYGGPEYLHGLSEIFIEGVYCQSLPDNAYILDCGAHIGLSVIYLKSICPSARIVAFEPDEKNYSLLLKNIESHQLDNVDARQEAVWIEDTMLSFIQEGNMGSKIGSGVSENTRQVKAIKLRNFLDHKVDFLKLDIEGAEYKVLNDIREKLHFVTNLFIEYHGAFSQNNELLEILQIVSTAGFKFYIKEAAGNYAHPFLKTEKPDYDIQLNVFCFRK